MSLEPSRLPRSRRREGRAPTRTDLQRRWARGDAEGRRVLGGKAMSLHIRQLDADEEPAALDWARDAKRDIEAAVVGPDGDLDTKLPTHRAGRVRRAGRRVVQRPAQTRMASVISPEFHDGVHVRSDRLHLSP